MRSKSKGMAGSLAGLTALVAVTLGLSALSGCGEEKKLPGAESTGTEPQVNSTPTVPAVSEEAARRVVDRAIKVMTDGHPERIEKTKVNRSTAKGHYFKPVNGQFQFVETTRQFQAVYPDRVRVEYDFQSEGNQLTIGLRRPAGVWARVTVGQPPVFDPQQFAEIVAVDAVGTYWLLTLTPLSDPKTVVFGLTTTPAGGRPFDTLKAVVPGYPVVFTLWFDQATWVLTRIEYANLEAGALVTKALAVSEYKPFAGLTLPTKIDYRRDGRIAEQWTVESWEFPDKIDEAVFIEPK
jgi:hypothetical protein